MNHPIKCTVHVILYVNSLLMEKESFEKFMSCIVWLSVGNFALFYRDIRQIFCLCKYFAKKKLLLAKKF